MTEIFYFSTEHCGPCKMFKPVVQGVASETNTNVTYVDAQRNEQLAAQHNIRAVPTIIVAKNGATVYHHTGVLSKQQLAGLFSMYK